MTYIMYYTEYAEIGGKGGIMEFIVKYVCEHVEVYDKQGRFLFSADTLKEAQHEIRRMAAA